VKLVLRNTLSKLRITPKTKDIIILTYHGIVDEISNARLQRNFHTVKQFSKHIEILKKRKYQFLNASELTHYIENPIEIKNKKLVCITFDDGYQNNLKAIEILEKNKIAGTFFISTDCIGTETSIWTVNLSLLLLEGNLETIKSNNATYSLSNEEEKSNAFNVIRNYLKTLDAEKRKLLFNEIQLQFPENELERLMQNHSYFKMLSWDEMRKVQNKNIQFHSHGHFHEIHHENQLTEILKSEIEISKEIIEQNLKNEVFLFAYPNGNYNTKSNFFLENSGYKTALVLNQKIHDGTPNKFSITRITPNGKKDKFLKQIL